MTQNFTLTRETIWHITCDACGFYWTYPTMRSDETLTGRQWHCPLCGKAGTAREAAADE